MSLIDLKFEKAAKILAESEDEVLQAAGLMALMRLETKDLFSAKDMVETLHRRLKQFDKEPKPLMPMRILVQNKDTTPSLNTSTAWCRTALPVATAQSVNSASLDLFSSPKSSCDSKTLATTVENSNILSSNLFSSPKSTFVFNTTPTTVQTANTIFSSVFTGPISSSGCNTTATTIQSVNVLGSSVFTRPSFDLNMTSTTTHSTNAISSILLPSAKTRGDLTNAPTATVSKTNTTSLRTFSLSSFPKIEMEPVATTSPMLINRS